MRALILALMAQAAMAAAACGAEGNGKPNIVVVLVDDMGFSDIGCYGSEIPTPNLDKLAANGLRFRQFYNTARCCPTRASLLTGLYAHQTGVGHMVEDRDVPGYRGRLNDQCVTLAEVLKPAGYFTIMVGKWHVGQNHGVTPRGRGFDRSLNAAAGGFYYADNPRAQLFLNGEPIDVADARLPQNWYSTDLWTDFSTRFIDEAVDAKQPFLLYLAHNAPHFPIQAPEEDVARFRGKYKAGWDRLREQRLEKQIKMGLIEPAWGISSRPDSVKAWDQLTAAEQDRFDQIMAIAAASIHAMDRSIGKLVDHLAKRGQLDNTLILFMSDNGGNAESGPDGKLEPPAQQKHTIAWTGQSWATLENTPFRRYKHFVHEGGISSPLIAHWPAGIKAKGEWRQQVSHLIDIMPTCVEVAGAKYPDQFNNKAILPMEGRSLVPAFANQVVDRGALFWEHEGNRAVRLGRWKLVATNGARWELYDLETDRTERHDRAAEMPDKVEELTALWNSWAKRAHVLPRPVAKKKAA